jgi:hypothetical protein
LRASRKRKLLNPLKTTINFHFNGTVSEEEGERESANGMSKWKIKAMNFAREIYFCRRQGRKIKRDKKKVVTTNNHKSFNFLASI